MAFESLGSRSAPDGGRRPGTKTIGDPTFWAVLDRDKAEDTSLGIKSRREASVYFLHIPDAHRVKIGFSKRPRKRLSAIRGEAGGLDVLLIGCIDGGRRTERVLHERFAGQRIAGEWFSDEILPDVFDLIREDLEWFGEAA